MWIRGAPKAPLFHIAYPQGVDMNSTDEQKDSSEGGEAPPNVGRRGAKRRRLSGPSRAALEDLYLIFLILASDLGSHTPQEAAGALRANLNQWRRIYL